MSQTFTPSNAVDMTKEKDWPLNLGMMDWDSVNIVFTKRSLLEFLKYAGVTVDTNFLQIQKLPRYAKFGKLSGDESAAPASTEPTAATATPVDPNIPKPSRRVRDLPGGAHTDIFGSEFTEEEDALSAASRPAPPPAVTPAPVQDAETEEEHGIPFSSAPKPSRRVRAPPGGNSSLGASFWGTDEEQAPEFRPTRRVTQETGGKDSISSIF